ncbi:MULTISPECIES: DUF6177 family protein [unclassified Streptomyces]|uniref:DUF6177 family protein n=1 Tax=unclassified Streptomyces TaxID=2593676 RepID=UPI002DD99A8A|nr:MULTISPECIES: DUF6177 family protein [unclassified Streptomyces]WSF85356.1 DUF6177 family protein [Streptomyces sp. NBC_01744]WSC38354.1 DUF6177 family protein [Streptomyces sp. NBC_01763]WSC46493.1 DUF6177 family protein [Streptomyces sp. NBC_01762]WSC54518.1 DUF6177 family protein [Streptomyces sp. NBC_01761]WSD26145.1 DUF6177 family protein [Streptomyces sp. NBC_01751]
MTKDVIALTRRMPDPLTVLAGLLSGGPDKLVETVGEDAVVRLCDEQGRPLVSVEAPLLVQVAGEAERLLGATAPAVPFWWTEARATTGVEEAERLAGTFAARLIALAGGSAWPPEAARSVAVVKTDGVSVAPTPAAAQPAIDALTDKVAVVIQDRPVVAMTAWLSDAFRATADAELGLQIVTSPGTTLSPAVRNSLTGWPSRWVVQDERDGYYDGLSGAVLSWQNGMFATVEAADATPDDPRTPVAASFKEFADTGERQLAISFRTVHPADDRLVLGGALESVWRELTGNPPAGWGTAEPANLPWSLRQLTDVAHDRSPAPTWVVVVGSPDRPGLATVRISRTTGGVEEDVTLAFGYGAGEEPPVDALPRVAEILATRHHLQSMLIQLRKARRDLAVPPRFEGPGVPVAFVLGAEEVREMPGDRARRTPLSEPPVQLGPKTRPALYYPLPGDPSDLSGWQDFERLMRHLKGA